MPCRKAGGQVSWGCHRRASRWSRVSRPARRACSTRATPWPPPLRGGGRGRRAAASCSGWRISMPGDAARTTRPPSWRICAGWAWTGTARCWSSRSACRSTALAWTGWPGADCSTRASAAGQRSRHPPPPRTGRTDRASIPAPAATWPPSSARHGWRRVARMPGAWTWRARWQARRRCSSRTIKQAWCGRSRRRSATWFWPAATRPPATIYASPMTTRHKA